ncbi:tetratricopeptide repeat protein [Melittangium boletus]|uniref:Uncharacterized protein n=1 Tax=Melittangium boletus DSM 14713 TaxID=1294270 RepID=A0A250IC12_9BACT|nr:tetratricopeptide repeat protein [Melittangium boletus]ATB29379.1 hypothetical protein MEBOL_002828 [Melittangium boletus DSM 14713]
MSRRHVLRGAALLVALLMGPGCATSRLSRPLTDAERDTYEARLDRAQPFLGNAQGNQELESLARELETRLEHQPQDARLHALLARTALALKREEQARAESQRALELAPDSAESHYLRAFFLGGREQAPTALAEARRATELDPGRGRYWRLLGTLHLQLHQPTEARTAFERALALEPDNAQTLFLSGMLAEDEGKDDEALASFERARTVAPDFALAHTHAGRHLQDQGQFEAALACFQKAADLVPQDWRARERLVQLNQALGHTAQRDAERAALLKLRQEGRVDQDFFIREQWREAGQTLVVVENFELTGDWARRYEFQVFAPGLERPERVISLGSYAFTNAFAREKNPSAPRLFHLDAYGADDSHETYGLFEGEPSYDDTRARVLAILHGELAPTSSTKRDAR